MQQAIATIYAEASAVVTHADGTTDEDVPVVPVAAATVEKED